MAFATVAIAWRTDAAAAAVPAVAGFVVLVGYLQDGSVLFKDVCTSEAALVKSRIDLKQMPTVLGLRIS